MSVKTVCQWDTEYSADSVEWCPIPPHENIFTCGTYQIIREENDSDCETSTQVKVGKLFLFAVNFSSGLESLQIIDTPAILDIKWCNTKLYDNIVVAVATADGCVTLYKLTSGNAVHGTCRLQVIQTIIVNGNTVSTLALSLDWEFKRNNVSNLCHNDNMLVVSDSAGFITLIKIQDANNHIILHRWKAHDFEAWITAFDYWNSSLIYTGGDDCKFKLYDVRCVDRPAFINNVHEAGVTSLHCNALFEHLLVSGSYDEKLRVWDTRNLKHPINILPLGGGIWRLKWNPQTWNRIIAACMHGHFKIVRLKESTHVADIIAEYSNHGSLAYGSDWCHLSEDRLKSELLSGNPHVFNVDIANLDNLLMIATCSFYDHKLCLSLFHES